MTQTTPASGTQNARVLRMLATRWNGITSLEAINELGVTRLAARIADLRSEGHVIEAYMVPVQNREGQTVRVARYRLIGR